MNMEPVRPLLARCDAAVNGEMLPGHGEPLVPGESALFPQLTSAADPHDKS